MSKTISLANCLCQVLFSCCIAINSFGQTRNINQSLFDAGFPITDHYSPKKYDWHAQCWGITQDEDGLMYFGNSNGVLQFDGNNWNKVELSNKSMVRKVVHADDGNIYCSGIGELGFINKDSIGGMQYNSLMDYLPEDSKHFTEIWEVVAHDDKVFFNAFYEIFVWDIKEKSFHILKAPVAYGSLFLVGNEVWVPVAYEGLKKYSEGKLVPLEYGGVLKTRTLAASKLKNGQIITFYYDGIYITEGQEFVKLNSDIDDVIAEFEVRQCLELDNGQLAILTSKKGLYVIARDGNLVSHFDVENGLPSINLHDGFIDNNGTMWLTSGQGISKMEFNVPIRIFDKRNEVNVTVNDILRYKDTLYVSSHSGLFYISKETHPQFVSIPPPITETFDLEIINEQLVVGTTRGMYVKQHGLDFLKIGNEYIDQIEQSTRDSSIVFLGTIDGLFITKVRNSGFSDMISYTNQVPEDIQSMVQSPDGNLWCGTSGSRIYELDFFNKGSLEEPKINIYDEKHGLPGGNIQIVNLQGQMVFGSYEGAFERVDGKFERSSSFTELQNDVYDMTTSMSGETYVLHDSPPSMKISIYNKENNGYSRIQPPELDYVTATGLWITYEDTDGSLWYGTSEGVINYSPNSYQVKPPLLKTVLSKVKVNLDSVISINSTGSQQVASGTGAIPYKDNTIRFEFALPSYADDATNQFQYKLEGLNDEWSVWSSETIKEYVNLHEGDYTFKVRGKNIQDYIGEEALYVFQILPPWYRTWWFLLCSLVLLVSILVYIIRYLAQKKLLARVKELEMEQKVQRERERISSDLHDHVGAQLTSIISGLSITENISGFDNNPELKGLVDSLKEDARNTMVNLRDSIWSLSYEAISVTELSEHLQTYLESYLKYHPGIDYRVDSDVCKNGLIEPAEGLNITRVIQEAVQNIIKHANASSVTITITDKENNFKVTIQDNGQGFDLDAQEGEHYGIDNMRMRMEKVGGTCMINSSSEGTVVELEITNYPKRGIEKEQSTAQL